MQVSIRAKALHLSRVSAVEAWRAAENTYAQAQDFSGRAIAPGTEFNGDKVSALNRLLQKEKHVHVTSPDIFGDEPLILDHPGMSIDFGKAAVHAASSLPYVVRIENTADVAVTGGRFDGGHSSILIANSQRVLIRNSRFENLPGVGIAMVSASRIVVWNNCFESLHASPVLIGKGTHHSTVARNAISSNLGGSNWHAGIVLSDREGDIQSTSDAILKDGYWPAEVPITERTQPPYDNVLAFNQISANASSGIYLDGAVRNVIYGNEILGNAKEGMCLDNGSSANVVSSNTLRKNGQRWGKTDEDLERDFVRDVRRLPDKTSVAKLPAVSIDNAIFNIIVDNQIFHNFGGGIKMVRTGIANAVGLNTLIDNNDGRSAEWHFFGIELGAATADQESKELDFGGSRGNVVFSNIIRGDHYAGIFLADGSDLNDLFDNVILGSDPWSLESVKEQMNRTVNNLTNVRSRNVNPGLDPRLVELGAHYAR